MLLLELVTFSLAWWMGLFLIRRANDGPAMRWIGAGLLSYAVALALSAFSQFAGDQLAELLRLQVPVLLAPLFFWSGALWYLREDLLAFWANRSEPGTNKAVVPLILIATIAFGLGLAIIFLPLASGLRQAMIIGISFDLFIFGICIGILDAFRQGERFVLDFLYSLSVAEVAALIFGGQIGLVIWFATGLNLPMVMLLFGTTATAIFYQVNARAIQDRFDQLIFRRFPQLREERSALRAIAEDLPRSANDPAVSEWDEVEFAKLTRQALSHLSDLPKLAKNPLIHLPLVSQQIDQKGLDHHTLTRATELKELLTESIQKLKPHPDEAFGTGKAWRYYNVLYYPYVRGLRPYGRGYSTQDLDHIEQQALDWFIQEVPRRTLFNWQTTAAKLVAKDIQEQLGENLASI